MLLEDIRPDVKNNRSAERLYHKDIGFPDDVNLPRGFSPVVQLRYGGHAREESLVDRYGELKLPRAIDVRKGEIFEIGVTGTTVTKMAVRLSYDEKKDIVIVFIPSTGFVKTVWANLKTDQHKTLNRARYIDPASEKR